MSYAQKILEKFGWKEGDGLGKNNDGIKKPLKAFLKFDKDGLGINKAKEFNNHWWERVFNDAAKNVEVKEDGDNISVLRKTNKSVEITTKDYSVRKLKKKKLDNYDNFLLSSTLVNTGVEIANPFKIEVDEIKLAPHKPLTDEELFAACGGRTAHKGARHGLKLSGKLARIEKQEKELLLKMQTNSAEETPASWTVVNSNKKNKRKKEEEHSIDKEDKDESKLNDILFTTEYCIKSKKKRKEKKQTEEELSKSLGSFTFNLEKESVDDGSNNTSAENSEFSKKHKKSKKNKSGNKTMKNEDSDNLPMENCDAGDDEVCLSEPIKKKNKKCKHGIDKDAKEAHKKAKKMKKNLLHITQDLQQSNIIEP